MPPFLSFLQFFSILFLLFLHSQAIILLLKGPLESVEESGDKDKDSGHNEGNSGPLVSDFFLKEVGDTHPDSHNYRGKGHDEGDQEPGIDLSAEVIVAKHGALVVVKDVAVGRDVDEEEGDGPHNEGEPVVPLDVNFLGKFAVTVEIPVAHAGKVLPSANGCPVNPDPKTDRVLY